MSLKELREVQGRTSNTALVLAIGVLSIVGLKKIISYLRGEISANAYAPPTSLSELWGFKETDVLSPSSTLWMVDQQVRKKAEFSCHSAQLYYI